MIMMKTGGKRNQAIFLCVTDGRPFNTRQTTYAIRRAKKLGKFFLLVIKGRTINSYMMRLMKKWCSNPVAQFFFVVNHYKQIHLSLVNMAIQNLCTSKDDNNLVNTGKRQKANPFPWKMGPGSVVKALGKMP